MTKQAVDRFASQDEKQSYFKGNGVVVIETGLNVSS